MAAAPPSSSSPAKQWDEAVFAAQWRLAVFGDISLKGCLKAAVAWWLEAVKDDGQLAFRVARRCGGARWPDLEAAEAVASALAKVDAAAAAVATAGKGAAAEGPVPLLRQLISRVPKSPHTQAAAYRVAFALRYVPSARQIQEYDLFLSAGDVGSCVKLMAHHGSRATEADVDLDGGFGLVRMSRPALLARLGTLEDVQLYVCLGACGVLGPRFYEPGGRWAGFPFADPLPLAYARSLEAAATAP